LYNILSICENSRRSADLDRFQSVEILKAARDYERLSEIQMSGRRPLMRLKISPTAATMPSSLPKNSLKRGPLVRS